MSGTRIVTPEEEEWQDKKEGWQLGEIIGQIGAELVPIEQALGLKESEGGEPRYDDIPGRLDQLIRYALELSSRLADVRVVVLNLKQTLG